jgi:hypothetical protein
LILPYFHFPDQNRKTFCFASKFIRPGAVRVDHRLKHHGFHPFNTDLAATAALDLERQQLALVLQNRAAHKDYRVRVTKPERRDFGWN